MRKTKIICTLGPSCDSIAVLKEMIREGMNVARINMAHGEIEDHINRIQNVRRAASELDTFVPVMLDIKGPEIRIGKLKEQQVELFKYDEIILTTVQIEGDSHKISVNYPDLPNVIEPNCKILIDDGLIELHVQAIEGQDVYCTVWNGGILKPRKGVNLPGVKTGLPGITERDVSHILFGLQHGIDMIAVSFVRKAEDLLEVRRILEEHHSEYVQIIAKIENEEGIANLDSILEVSDGIMVARGDLGVEIPAEEVPLVQSKIIKRCNEAGKPVIVATHLLESMHNNPRPTRAEVSDISTAVLQGADVLMLSGETAAGKYPVESVRTMATIARKIESVMNYSESFSARTRQQATNITEVISQAAVRSSLELDAKAIITPTKSGFTARMVSKYRPKSPIIAITHQPHVMPMLCLLWGVTSVLGHNVNTTDEIFESAIQISGKAGSLQKGDLVIISAGVPFGQSGSTNLIKIHQV